MANLDELRHWPLLAGSAVCFATGIAVLDTADGRETYGLALAGGSLMTLGAVLVGAWVFALGRAGHDGQGPPDRG